MTSGCGDFIPPDGEDDNISISIIWEHPTSGHSSDWVQPVIQDNKTYFIYDSILTCYDFQRNKIIWHANLGNNSLGSSKLIYSNGKLFINHANWVKSYDLNGNLLWVYPSDPFKAIDLSTMTQNEDNLFLGRRGDVIRISKINGDLNMIVKLDSLCPPNLVQNAYDPVVSDDNLLYIPTGYYDSVNVKGNMFCYDALTGEYKWGYEIPVKRVKPPGSPDSVNIGADSYGCAVKNDKVVFAAGQTIFTLNRYTGKLIWERFFEDDGFGAGLTIEENTIYIGSQGDPHIYSLDLSTGIINWSSRTSGSVFNILTLKDGRVYYCNTLGGDIWIYDAGTGNVLWNKFPPEYTRDRNARYHSNVCVGEGYMVDVGTKYVYCLKISG
jgi:outer membrane protein assembly factor BamB